MSGNLIAVCVWGLIALGTIVAAWPRAAEQDLLAKSPRHLRLLLFLPFVLLPTR